MISAISSSLMPHNAGSVAPPAKLVKQPMFSGRALREKGGFQTVPTLRNLFACAAPGIRTHFLRANLIAAIPCGHDSQGCVLDAYERSREFAETPFKNL